MWKNFCVYVILISGSLVFPDQASAQGKTEVSGKVIDKATGEAIPFVNVYFKSSSVGVTTDFDGKYQVSSYENYDTLVASYIGYNTVEKPIQVGKKQSVDFFMDAGTVNLQEVVVFSGENPAWAIIRKAVKHKNVNDKRSLDSYEYTSYNKIEIDINNLSENLRGRKTFKKISTVIDSMAQLKGYDGNPVLPVFMSESLSKFYAINNPYAKREEILKSRIKGVGVDDGSFISQIVGASYQEYNFYRNWLSILDKEFVSPISDGWRLYYDYDLVDSLKVDGVNCYQLTVIPKRKEDPAFNGTIWISKDTYALKQVDLTIDKSTNLNFVDYLRVQQDLRPTDAGPWIPVKTRVLVDITPVDDETPGLLTKFYNSNEKVEVNAGRKRNFYESQVLVREDYSSFEEDFWEKNRHEPLKNEEIYAFDMIDTLRSIPVVKKYETIIKTLTTGYFRAGKVDYGPWPYVWAYNDFEGHRFRVGLRTNGYFSNKWKFKGYLAYGTEDENFKYGLYAGYIVSRFPWTEVGVYRKEDVEQVGLKTEDLQENLFFLAASRFGSLTRPYLHTENKVFVKAELVKGLNQTINLRVEHYDPQFPFYYYDDPANEMNLMHQFDVASVKYSIRYARDERFVQFENERVSLGINRWPSLELSYTYGMDGVLGGDLEYQKLEFDFRHRINFGFLGVTSYQINGGKILNAVPYMMLENHVGNESFFYTPAAFNTMNYFEFVSDTYAYLKLQHRFNGLIWNRLPLLRKLKWRLLATANILEGSLSDENKELIPEYGPDGVLLPSFKGLDDKPYVEVGYGVENVFKFFRFDVFHRISYLDEPDANKIAFKVSMQIIL